MHRVSERRLQGCAATFACWQHSRIDSCAGFCKDTGGVGGRRRAKCELRIRMHNRVAMREVSHRNSEREEWGASQGPRLAPIFLVVDPSVCSFARPFLPHLVVCAGRMRKRLSSTLHAPWIPFQRDREVRSAFILALGRLARMPTSASCLPSGGPSRAIRPAVTLDSQPRPGSPRPALLTVPRSLQLQRPLHPPSAAYI